MKYPQNIEQVINEFHKLYYNSHLLGGTWANTFWRGVRTAKCPLDLWIYQEIIYEVQPDYVIEAGTAWGGSAYYLASICDLAGHGHIITIDVEDITGRPGHNRITYIKGSSTDTEIIKQVKSLIGNSNKVMVVLDSDHTKEHVLREMQIYSKLVSVGSYMVVEDGNINGHPVLPEYGPGPMEAIQDFLSTSDEYMVDYSRQKFYLTFNPNGYLRRIRDNTKNLTDNEDLQKFKCVPGFTTPKFKDIYSNLTPEQVKQIESYVNQLEAIKITDINVSLYNVEIVNGSLLINLLFRNGTNSYIAVKSLPMVIKNSRGEITGEQFYEPEGLILEPVSARIWTITMDNLRQPVETLKFERFSIEFTGQPHFEPTV